jgi:hypothetical protein
MTTPLTSCQLYHVLAVVTGLLCLIALSVATPNKDAAGAPAEVREQSRLQYILANLRRRAELSAIAPPNVYQNKMAPYGNAPTAPMKRASADGDGFWIWMPAQGYVNVPRDEAAGAGGGASNSNLLRYGR